MKAGYKPCSLGSVAKVIAGQSPEGKYYNDKGEGLPFYQGKKEFGERVIGEPTTWTTDVTKIGEPGDILMSVRAPVGPVNFTDQKICIGRGLAAIRSSETIDSDFLYYQLLSKQDEIAGTEGAVFASINKAAIEALQVVVPAIEEQRRIFTLLDEAFADNATAKANTEKNLQNARELFDSALNAIEGKKEQLGEYVTIKTGKLDANAAVIDGEYPFFTCSREIFAIDTFAFDCEAILLAGNNAVGDFNVKHYCGKFNAYQRTYVITIQDQEILRYRYLYFQMLKSLKKFKEQSVGSSTKFLKLGMIKELEITLPPIHEQDRQLKLLSGLLEQVEDLESIYQQKLTALDDLKKSLLHQAFSGQL